jgi:S-adenosylmethionine:tRNA ribosyltransferase-isomerase
VNAPYFYNLPEYRIAQRPVYPPEKAAMLVWNGVTGCINDSTFEDLTAQLLPSDVLVFNNTQVIPARLFGRINEKEVEILLLKQETNTGVWRCLARPLKKLKRGTVVHCGQGVGLEVKALILERVGDSEIFIQFEHKGLPATQEVLAHVGIMPIPPYIRKGRADEHDKKDYQTIFAKHQGSVAAPTASLHFSEKLCSGIQKKGVTVEFLTLHIGAASFLPLQRSNEESFTSPGSEALRCDKEVWKRLCKYKQEQRRIIAVGTTVVRALESLACNFLEEDKIFPEWMSTELFIIPNHVFKMVDCLITNFHQPGTTHLLLVESLVGRSNLERIYSHALASHFGYRFLSYGDGMFLTP